MVKTMLTTAVILMLWSATATPQVRSEIGHCVTDLGKLCAGVLPGDTEGCLTEHLHDVSYPCLLALAALGEVRESNDECRGVLKQQCAGVEREEAKLGVCLRSAVANLSKPCKDALARAVSRER